MTIIAVCGRGCGCVYGLSVAAEGRAMLITEQDGGVYNAIRKSARKSHMENKVRMDIVNRSRSGAYDYKAVNKGKNTTLNV